MSDNSTRLLSSTALAAQLGCTTSTLRRWRSIGEGPAYFTVNGRTVYAEADVHAWVEAQRRSSTPKRTAR